MQVETTRINGLRRKDILVFNATAFSFEINNGKTLLLIPIKIYILSSLGEALINVHLTSYKSRQTFYLYLDLELTVAT